MSFLTTFHAQRGFYPVSLLRRRLEIGSNIRTAGTASGHAQGTCRAANSCARLSLKIASASSARIKKGLWVLQSPFADQNGASYASSRRRVRPSNPRRPTPNRPRLLGSGTAPPTRPVVVKGVEKGCDPPEAARNVPAASPPPTVMV